MGGGRLLSRLVRGMEHIIWTRKSPLSFVFHLKAFLYPFIGEKSPEDYKLIHDLGRVISIG